MEGKIFSDKRNLIIVFIIVVIFLTRFPIEARAQTGNVTIQIVSGGNISVSVNDSNTNNAIDSATVIIIEQGGNETLSSGTTNSSGIFISDQLLAGNYTITASKSGYDSNSTNATVNSSQTTDASIKLKRSAGGEGGGGGTGGGGGGEGEGGKKRKDIDIDFEKKDEHRKTPHEGDSLLMRIIGPVERTAEGVALVAKGAKIDFEEHLVIINDVSINRVNITISSTPVNLLLEVGKPGYVDFDNDDRADVKIVVNSISGDNTDISFTSYRTLRILSYPAEIYIPQGSSDLYIITTINNGVNEQKDISLSVSGAPYSINITPLIIPGLKKNEIAIFAMSLYVPDDAIVGMDKLLLEITSNRITKDYDIGLHIDENLEKSFEKREIKRLEREIANAQFVANEIWNVALQKQIQGFDVSRVLTHLRIVNRNLAEAKTALTPGKLEKASGLVLVAKKHIEEAVILLSKAKISPSSVLLYAAVIGFAAFVIFAIAKYAKGIKKKISRKKELKEVEEKLEEWEER